MTDQERAPSTGGEPTYPEYDRRRGPRRAEEIDQVPFERRQGDRRQRKPGFAGLWSALFGRGPEQS